MEIRKRRRRGKGRGFIAVFGLFEAICRQKSYQRQWVAPSEAASPMMLTVIDDSACNKEFG